MRMSKKKKLINKEVDLLKKYTLKDALEIQRKYATKKFDESIDICIKLGVDAKKSDQAIRGVMKLPNRFAKEITVAVFAEGKDAENARNAGADLVGSDELIEEVKSGKINFSKCISTPEMMAKVGTLGQVLGPKGMMPNPKLGTVSKDMEKAVGDLKEGQLEFKTDKGGLVHASIGKCSLNDEQIVNNAKFFYNEILKNKPSSSKGIFIKGIFISTTLGPGLKIEESSVI
ncbi:MAG: 50S ribosomal protein L1 [Rickettsiales bacterium]|nr:50S ribosomal protein L1 [Rickettsiales bacterium]